MMEHVQELKEAYPLIKEMEAGKEVVWMNPGLSDLKTAMEGVSLSMDDIDDAENRWARFAPFIRKMFPETEAAGGLIESPLRTVDRMKDCLNRKWGAGLEGRLMLKMDSNLAVAGSVKARGGIYEILKHSEDLALEHGMITLDDNYEKFSLPQFREFFGKHSIHVGSTGNLGLSIGIISAALGYDVTVHMSMDAKQWKKDLLRQKGVHKGSGACILFQRYTRKSLQLLVLQLPPFQFPEAAARYENIAYGLDLKLPDSPPAGKGRSHHPKINPALFQAFDGFRGRRIGNIHLNLRIFPVKLFQKGKKIKLQRHIAGPNPHFPHIHIQHPLQHLPAFQQILHTRLHIVV